jgi:hypothetical protein
MKYLPVTIPAVFICMLLSCASLSAEQQVSRVPNTQEKTYSRLAKLIGDNLPKNIEILIYELILLNGSDSQQADINNNVTMILTAKQFLYDFKVHFINKIINDNDSISKEDIIANDELEMIALGKVLNLDAVLVGTVTIKDDETKKVWDSSKKRFIEKRVALLQGNVFSTENNQSLLRFSYTFLVD